MIDLLLALIAAGRVFFRSRADTALEVLALRQQVGVLKRKHPRPTVNRVDRVLWTCLQQVWPRWKDALIIVKPETVIGWHRAGFRLYWRWRSRRPNGHPKLPEEIRTLIRRLAAENAGWGAPKIHGELLKLGSTSRNGPSAGTCGACGAVWIRQGAGVPFSTTIARRSSRSTALPFRRPRFICCTASL